MRNTALAKRRTVRKVTDEKCGSKNDNVILKSIDNAVLKRIAAIVNALGLSQYRLDHGDMVGIGRGDMGAIMGLDHVPQAWGEAR